MKTPTTSQLLRLAFWGSLVFGLLLPALLPNKVGAAILGAWVVVLLALAYKAES